VRGREGERKGGRVSRGMRSRKWKIGAEEKNLPPGRMEHGASSCPPSCPSSLPASAGDKRVGGGEAVILPP